MHPKHIKPHKKKQKLTSLTSVVRSIRSRQNPRGQVDMAMPVLLRRKATWKHETVSRIWICLPALQEYVHTSISTIMLYIYNIICIYIYSHTTHLSGPIPSITNDPIFWEKMLLS